MTPVRKPGEWLGEVVPVRRKRADGIALTGKYRVVYDARSVTRHWTPEAWLMLRRNMSSRRRSNAAAGERGSG